MNNQTILYYVIKLLIIIAQTSDMSPMMKQYRVERLTALATEVGVYHD